jgi:hypothetical protein
MTRRLILGLLLAGFVAGGLTGCGGGRSNGKNKDLDRPLPTAKP